MASFKSYRAKDLIEFITKQIIHDDNYEKFAFGKLGNPIMECDCSEFMACNPEFKVFVHMNYKHDIYTFMQFLDALKLYSNGRADDFVVYIPLMRDWIFKVENMICPGKSICKFII